MSEVTIPTTDNLHLKKPTYSNFADIKDAVDDNMDILDDEITKIAKRVYPVGSIYMSVNNTSPATLFPGTTWQQIKDKFMLAAGTTYSGGATGGAATKSYTPAGSVGSHTLTASEIPSHRHSISDHTHTVSAHSHGLNSHTHSIPAHSHSVANGAGYGFATFDTNTDIYNTGCGFGPSKASGGKYYASYSVATANGGSGTTGAATGNTASGGGGSTGSAGAGNTGYTGSGGGHNHSFTGTAANINVMPPYLVVYMWKRTA